MFAVYLLSDLDGPPRPSRCPPVYRGCPCQDRLGCPPMPKHRGQSANPRKKETGRKEERKERDVVGDVLGPDTACDELIVDRATEQDSRA